MSYNQNIDLFLAQQNLADHYKFVCQEVQQRSGTNINKYKGMEPQFQKMAQIVAKKHANNMNLTLSELNTTLKNNSVKYFVGIINKKNAMKQKQTGMESNPIQTNNITNMSNQQNAQNNNGINTIDNTQNKFGFTMVNTNDDINNNYNNIMNERNTINREYSSEYGLDSVNKVNSPIATSINPPSPGGKNMDNVDKLYQEMLENRGQINIPDSNETKQPNINNFDINDELMNLLTNEQGQNLPLFQNVLNIEANENLSIDDKIKRIENERRNILESRKNQQKQNNGNNNTEPQGLVSNNMLANNLYETNNVDNIDNNQIMTYENLSNEQKNELSNRMMGHSEDSLKQERSNLDRQLQESFTNNGGMDSRVVSMLNKEATEEEFNRMNANVVNDNDVRSLNPLIDNLLMEKLMSLQRKNQPEYIERSNYIIVNSIDRDWFNNSNETRYNFKVVFRKGSTYNGAGIIELYKNITSVELVNAILPQDNVLLPFDTRPYLDILHFPYMLLEIPEFQDVFHGTNQQNDRAFSVLIYDKQGDSTVLSSDYVSSMVHSTPNTQFYKEYRKTFYKFTPAYFEKKVFYNAPLASLPQMNIKLNTPSGENINVLNDVLTIQDIAYTTTLGSNLALEYSNTLSYPNDSAPNSRAYLRIQSSTCFSNKLFKLGDNIKIKGYEISGSLANNTVFNNYINRDEGHYILNLDQSNMVAGGNQGFISNLYIAPPGDLSSDLCELDASTYLDGTTSNLSSYTSNTAKLINGNLQTHFLFKITTREGNVQTVTMPMNI
jgi:hypothetical protein